jgi:hypothetical protein
MEETFINKGILEKLTRKYKSLTFYIAINKLKPNFRWRATCRWKAIDKGYNFVSDLILIGGLYRKLWALKVVGVPSLGISKLPLRESPSRSFNTPLYP